MSFAELEVLVNGLRRSEDTVLNGEVVKEYFVGEQSYECLKELQRFLRREKLSYTKDVLKQLGSWNIVKNQLLPLMISLQFENQEEDVDIYGMSYEICKLLVMLTMPPEPKSYDIPLQISYLQDFKEAFLVYPNNEAISSFVHLFLTEPLSREGRSRTEEDERLIELILSLLKNLLLIPDRVLQSGASASFHKTQLQDDLFAAFKKADVFDLLMMMTNNLVVKGSTKVFDFEDEEEEEEEKEEEEEQEDQQESEEKNEAVNDEEKPEEEQVEEGKIGEAANEEEAASKMDAEGEVVEEVVEESHLLHRQIDNDIKTVVKKRETGFKKWSMLLLELYTLILKREKPEQLVHTYFKYHSLANKKPTTPEELTDPRYASHEKSKPALGRTPLSALLTAEHNSMWKTNRSPVQTVVAKRGTYIIQEGSHVIVKKGLTEATTAHSMNAALNAPPIKRNARNQKTLDNMNTNSVPSVGVTGDQAQLLLREFVQNFLDRGCYNSLMDCAKQQLKDPATQTSHILSDQVNFILLVKFFTGYVYYDYSLRKQLRGQQSCEEIDITQLRNTIHSSDFREILAFCALYFDEKNWTSLTVAVSALKNMFNVMKALSGCPGDAAQLIAKKLHHQVFYYDTTLESIINIMKSFDSSKHTLSYLREIVELQHVVNSLVAHNGPVIVQHKKKRINTNRKKKKGSSSLIDDEAQKDEEGGSKEAAKEVETEKKDGDMAVEKESTEAVATNSQENSEDVRAVKDFIETLDSEQKKKDKEAMKEIEAQQKEAEKNVQEEEEEEDEEDEEDREVYLEKVVNMEEYYSKFAHPTIIQNYSLLLKHYKHNPPALNHFLVSFLNRICTHTPFEPMLYQLSIISILNEILNDKTINSSQSHEELVSFAAKVARNFLQVLKEEENLSVLVFAWKKKQDCYHLHPKGSNYHDKFQKSEVKKKEKSKENNTKKDKKQKKVTIQVDIAWNEEEDNNLRELYEKYKNSDICFDLIYPHFTHPEKRSIQAIFNRLKQLNIISQDHAKPQELEESEAESSEEEEDDIIIRLDDTEEKEAEQLPKETKKKKEILKEKPIKRSEPKKQKKNKTEEKKVLDEKRKEALETMKQRLSDVKKRKRERRLSTEPEDLQTIIQEAQFTSPNGGRLNRKTVQDEEFDLDMEEEESPLHRKTKKAKVTGLQQAVDLDDLFHESEVVDDYANIPVDAEDDMMDQEDKENSPVNIPTNNQTLKKVGSVVLDEDDSAPIKVANKKKKLMIFNDDD